MEAFRGLAVAAAVSVYALIVIGGFVSSTGSGLACPDWPLCNGQIIPEMSGPVLIEYTHRVWSMVTFLLVVATAVSAWRNVGISSRITMLAIAGLASILVQVFLGMFTVLSLTHPFLVTAHLALGTLVFGLSLITAVLAVTSTASRKATTRSAV